MELTNFQANVILKALDDVLDPASGWRDGPFMDQLRGVVEHLRKGALIYWTPDNYPPEVGNWVSACCERSLRLLQTKEDVDQVLDLVRLGQSFCIFWTRESGESWLKNDRLDEEIGV